MKKFLLLFAVCICMRSLAQTPDFISAQLDEYIKEGMRDWNIPGLAIAIVKDGKVVVMKGYGVRDIKTKEPVDENTLFMIASNSKLFTGTALAQLEYNKKLSLDDKIIKYFKNYRVYDSNVTQLVTIRDMLSHHLGTKTFQGDFTFWNAALSRQEMINRMRTLKPSGQFRQSYGYCNSCFLTAGEIIPLVSGKPWEVYVYDSIIVPLGMTNTHTLGAGMDQRPNASKPYTTQFTGQLSELPYDRVDNLAPAGSIVSNVKDLSKWLMMQLDSGRFEGKRILPWQVLQKTRDINTAISSRRSSNGLVHFVGYGLGVFESDYNGKQIFYHTGGADGFVTNTCFVPEEKLGITILTNQDNQSFFELLRYQILNAYLHVPFNNLSKAQLPAFMKELHTTADSVKYWQSRVKDEKPVLPISSYAGDYTNEVYGPISIKVKDANSLEINFRGHTNLTGRVDYMDNGEWLLTYSNIAYGIFPLRFTIENKKIKSVEVRVNDFIELDPYVFVKK